MLFPFCAVIPLFHVSFLFTAVFFCGSFFFYFVLPYFFVSRFIFVMLVFPFLYLLLVCCFFASLVLFRIVFLSVVAENQESDDIVRDVY